jgi:hypothetical protein
MPTTLSVANAQAIQMCDAAVDACDLGSSDATADLVIYSGTAPTNVDTALSGNTVLASLLMSNPAFGAASDQNPNARATANAISDDTSADATGTATFYRILDRNNVPRIQGPVGATGSGNSLELVSTSIVAGVTVSVTSLTVTQLEA